MKQDPTYEDTSRTEEILNITTHACGILLAIVALILLIIKGMESNDWLYFSALTLYGLTMLWTYTTSTAFHSSFKASSRNRNIFHLLDHTAIYLFIAGTYTPIALFVLPDWWSLAIFIGIWSLAILGVVFKIFSLGRFKKLSLTIYLLMGWMIIVAIKPLVDNAHSGLLFWIFAGAAAYSIGTVFFTLEKLRFHHSIWHLFVMGGSFCHFMGIYLYV